MLAVDPSLDSLARLRSSVETLGRSCRTFCAPHGDEKAIDDVVALSESLWPSLDGLLVTAAVFDWWRSDQESMDLWEQLLRVDLLMPIFYARRLRDLLSRSGTGAVVFYGSIDGTYGNPRVPAYSAARGGLVPAVHTLAHAMGADGIRVNLIAGAAIRAAGPDAPPVEGALSNPRELLRSNALRRMAEPAEVASVASFLLSSGSSYMTGAVVPLDGGRMAVTAGTGLLPDIAEAAEW